MKNLLSEFVMTLLTLLFAVLCIKLCELVGLGLLIKLTLLGSIALLREVHRQIGADLDQYLRAYRRTCALLRRPS